VSLSLGHIYSLSGLGSIALWELRLFVSPLGRGYMVDLMLNLSRFSVRETLRGGEEEGEGRKGGLRRGVQSMEHTLWLRKRKTVI